MPVPAKKSASYASPVVSLAKIHFVYVFAFAAYIVAYHAGNVITLQAVRQRWGVTACMLLVTTTIWYVARSMKLNTSSQKILLWALVIMDILVASYMVYAERGMQSLGVALFAIPIVSAGLLGNGASFAVASLSTAGYSFAAVKYFTDFFNEGYKVQLYSTIGFYSVCFFLLAALVILVIHRPNKL